MVALAIVFITVAYDFVRLERQRLAVIAQLERESALVARALEAPFQYWMRTGNRLELEHLLRDIREAKGALCVGIYNLAGALDIASRTGPAAGGGEECPAALDGASPGVSVLSRWTPLGTFSIAAPLTRDGARAATLKLVLPSTVITDPVRRQRDVLIVERGLVLVAIGVTLWLAISLTVGRPIRRLMRGVEAIGQGDLETRIDARSRTELGDLARAFNRTAESLQEAHRRSLAEQDRRVALERQLRHTDKLAAIGQLAGEVAHEVGTPLNVIAGRARSMRREFSEGDPRAEGLDIIRNQVDRISRVIARILKAARPARMQREQVALRPIAEELAAFVAPELRRRDVRLALAIPDDLPTITADPDGLSQVLLNLIMNAIAAVSPGGRIEVVAAPAGGAGAADASPGSAPRGIEVRVSDDGRGIAPEVLTRVFEPFFSTKREQGTGLGLSICRDIVRDHGGRITAESHLGTGTTIRLWLPAVPREPAHEPATPPHH
jgi:signal transduction histidine kinase